MQFQTQYVKVSERHGKIAFFCSAYFFYFVTFFFDKNEISFLSIPFVAIIKVAYMHTKPQTSTVRAGYTKGMERKVFEF